METVKQKFEKITHAWTYYFLEYKYCQYNIRFDHEVQTNYYGDIFHFFGDTLNCIDKIHYYDNFEESIFQAVGILQIIYAHQDLIDELLYIFKLEKSKPEDKNPNRKIRNELVGHPIRRRPKDKKLISSVFLGNEFSGANIHYVLYSADKNFSGESVLHHVDDIVSRHNFFLNKYLDIIWGKIEIILRKYQTILVKLNDLISKKISFEKLVVFVSQNFESVFKDNYLFKKDYLIKCLKKKDEHKRYNNAIELFIQALQEQVTEKIKNISVFLMSSKEEAEQESINVEVKFGYASNPKPVKIEQKYFDYEFSKLHERHPIFGIKYFKKHFKDDALILEEIINMENNQTSEMEYYCSYEYLRILLIQKDLLNRRDF